MTAYIVCGALSVAAATVILWPARTNRRFCIIIGALFCVSALALYGWVGAPHIIPALEQYAETQAAARQVIITESAVIKKDAKNLEAWIRLGQAFAETSQWEASANAFKRSVLLSEGNPDLIMAYARALIMADGGKVNDHARKSLEMVLLQKPEHPEARYYMNVRLLQDGKTQEAMQAMKKLYHSLPEDSPVRAMIDREIGRK